MSPHGPEVPTSIWNVTWNVWVGMALHVDAYLKPPAPAKRSR